MAYVSQRRQKIREEKAIIEQRKQTREQAKEQSVQPTESQGYVSERRQAIRESKAQVQPDVVAPETSVQTAQEPAKKSYADLHRERQATKAAERTTEISTSEPVTPENEKPDPVRKAIQMTGALGSKLLSALGLKNEAKAAELAAKITPEIVDTGADIIKGGLSAGAEGTVRGIGAISDLISMGTEGAYKLIGAESPYANKERREKDSQAREELIQDIRKDLGIDPEKMSKAGQLVYSTATNILLLAGNFLFLSAGRQP